MTHERRTIEEAYGLATQAKNLSQKGRHKGVQPVDLLGAAGMVGQASRRAVVATSVHRLVVAGDRSVIVQLVPELADWVMRFEPPNNGGWVIRRTSACDVAQAVLLWLAAPACRDCSGRRYQLLAGTNVLGDELCGGCDGSGRVPLDSLLPRKLRPYARWLACELEGLCASVQVQLVRRLVGDLNVGD